MYRLIAHVNQLQVCLSAHKKSKQDASHFNGIACLEKPFTIKICASKFDFKCLSQSSSVDGCGVSLILNSCIHKVGTFVFSYQSGSSDHVIRPNLVVRSSYMANARFQSTSICQILEVNILHTCTRLTCVPVVRTYVHHG